MNIGCKMGGQCEINKGNCCISCPNINDCKDYCKKLIIIEDKMSYTCCNNSYNIE